MGKALIVYFSQKGTNMRVADSIGAGLQEVGHDVTMHNLKDGRPPAPKGYDLFGIGSPTYYFRPPFIVTDYVNALPELTGLPVFVFVVHAAYRGNTGDNIRHTLERKGAREVGYFHCYGAGYFLGYLKEGYLFSADRPDQEDLVRAQQFGRDVAFRLAGEHYTRPGKDAPLGVIYRIERFLTNRMITTQVYSRLFRQKTKCPPGCDLCITQCPMQNIARGTDGRLVRGRNCLLCLSCETNCPEDAIVSPVSWSIFHPFMIYNTRRAARDPRLTYAKVVHHNGRTQRV